MEISEKLKEAVRKYRIKMAENIRVIIASGELKRDSGDMSITELLEFLDPGSTPLKD